MALVFQLPIVLTALIRLKILSTTMLKASRRYVYIAMIIGVALLPPNDIISLIALSIPPLLLFELTLVFNKNYVYYVILSGGRKNFVGNFFYQGPLTGYAW